MITSSDFVKAKALTSDSKASFLNTFDHPDPSDPKEPLSIDKNLLKTPSNNDYEKLDLALRYLQQDPAAAEVIKQVLDKGTVIVILNDHSPSSHNFWKSSDKDGVIFWNPNQHFEFTLSDGKTLGKQSPANVLLHEMIHATDTNLDGPLDEIVKYQNIFPTSSSDYKYFNNTEKKAVESANKMVSEPHGEPIRPAYLFTNTNPNQNSHPDINHKAVFPLPSAKSPIDFETKNYDKQGKLIEEISQVYDPGSKTVKRTITDHLKLNEYGQPTVTEEIRDLDGKTITPQPSVAIDLSQPLAKEASVQEFNNYGFAALLSDNDSRFTALDSMMSSNIGREAEQQSREAVLTHDVGQEHIREANTIKMS